MDDLDVKPTDNGVQLVSTKLQFRVFPFIVQNYWMES